MGEVDMRAGRYPSIFAREARPEGEVEGICFGFAVAQTLSSWEVPVALLGHLRSRLEEQAPDASSPRAQAFGRGGESGCDAVGAASGSEMAEVRRSLFPARFGDFVALIFQFWGAVD